MFSAPSRVVVGVQGACHLAAAWARLACFEPCSTLSTSQERQPFRPCLCAMASVAATARSSCEI
eukprot:5758059-Pyramimonas_sp.AAC.1